MLRQDPQSTTRQLNFPTQIPRILPSAEHNGLSSRRVNYSRKEIAQQIIWHMLDIRVEKRLPQTGKSHFRLNESGCSSRCTFYHQPCYEKHFLREFTSYTVSCIPIYTAQGPVPKGFCVHFKPKRWENKKIHTFQRAFPLGQTETDFGLAECEPERCWWKSSQSLSS